MYCVLLVEDDPDISLITRMNLIHAGYEVEAAYTAAEALKLLNEKSYDLILLDEMLPDRRGSELCGLIRTFSDTPIIFMSCLDDSATIVRALHNGGDDYVKKPIAFEELLARAEAMIRRTQRKRPTEQKGRQRFRQFSIDTVRHCILHGEEEVQLSSIEFNLLCYMSAHPNILLTYQNLYETVWDSDSLGDVRTLMVHISNLRKKVDPERTGIIENIRGAGYIFADV